MKKDKIVKDVIVTDDIITKDEVKLERVEDNLEHSHFEVNVIKHSEEKQGKKIYPKK